MGKITFFKKGTVSDVMVDNTMVYLIATVATTTSTSRSCRAASFSTPSLKFWLTMVSACHLLTWMIKNYRKVKPV